jgi:hypothetical protein
VAPIEEHPEYDSTIPTPDVAVDDQRPANPEPGDDMDDTPPAGLGQYAEGAVDEDGLMLDSDGNVALFKNEKGGE